MIIDFHTHIYPDALAARIMAALSEADGVQGQTGGTLRDLTDSMKIAGIDNCVVLPVNTRKGQFDSINKFAKHLNETHDELISFGGIHPDDDDISAKIAFLKDKGFKGVKIHPDYTETYIDDERYFRIIVEAQKAGLIVVTHAGKDPNYSDIHCPPDKGRATLDRVYAATGFTKPFFVFAHLGGNRLLREAEQYLVGQNCYIDISCSFKDIGDFSDATDEDVVRVIKNHGADKILFGTDSPWNDQKAYVDHFRQLSGLTDNEKEMIFGGNAGKLLQLR